MGRLALEEQLLERDRSQDDRGLSEYGWCSHEDRGLSEYGWWSEYVDGERMGWSDMYPQVDASEALWWLLDDRWWLLGGKRLLGSP